MAMTRPMCAGKSNTRRLRAVPPECSTWNIRRGSRDRRRCSTWNIGVRNATRPRYPRQTRNQAEISGSGLENDGNRAAPGGQRTGRDPAESSDRPRADRFRLLGGDEEKRPASGLQDRSPVPLQDLDPADRPIAEIAAGKKVREVGEVAGPSRLDSRSAEPQLPEDRPEEGRLLLRRLDQGQAQPRMKDPERDRREPVPRPEVDEASLLAEQIGGGDRLQEMAPQDRLLILEAGQVHLAAPLPQETVVRSERRRLLRGERAADLRRGGDQPLTKSRLTLWA